MKAIIQTILKGAAMGAADAVPGVSGGTLALILGVYERLIKALSSFNLDVVKMILTGKIKDAWQAMDATFLVQLFGGIIVSLLSLLQLVGWMIEHQPIILWSFFLGLVSVSVWYLVRQFKWTKSAYVAFPLGMLISVAISLLTPSTMELTILTALIGGAIAICAMILPGISGSFMLILMGLYGPVSAAVKNMDFAIIISFAAGCAIGLLSFSKLLNWLLAKYHSITLALMSGIVAGAVVKLWPWQNWTAQMQAKELKSFVEGQWYLPSEYAVQTGDSSQIVAAVIAFLIGGALILLLDYVGNKKQSASTI